MVYITGDTHRNFTKVYDFCYKNHTSKNDILIILGDSGINIYGDRDKYIKQYLSELPITFFCIRGNHEFRPEHIIDIKKKKFTISDVYYEEKFPNILYAIDGNEYLFNNKRYLVIGGAYSVDKDIRLKYGYPWFHDEQLSQYEMDDIFTKIIDRKGTIYEGVLSHTCPLQYMPKEWFLDGIDQNKVDISTEWFLSLIERNIIYNNWFCGHFHGDKQVKIFGKKGNENVKNIIFLYNFFVKI